MRPGPQERQVVGLQRRLGRGLLVADRDRRVLVGAWQDALRQEEVAGHPVEELEQLQVLDAVRPDVLDELAPVPDEARIVYRPRSHPRISSSSL